MDIYGHYIQEADQKMGEDMYELFSPLISKSTY